MKSLRLWVSSSDVTSLDASDATRILNAVKSIEKILYKLKIQINFKKYYERITSKVISINNEFAKRTFGNNGLLLQFNT